MPSTAIINISYGERKSREQFSTATVLPQTCRETNYWSQPRAQRQEMTTGQQGDRMLIDQLQDNRSPDWKRRPDLTDMAPQTDRFYSRGQQVPAAQTYRPPSQRGKDQQVTPFAFKPTQVFIPTQVFKPNHGSQSQLERFPPPSQVVQKSHHESTSHNVPQPNIAPQNVVSCRQF